MGRDKIVRRSRIAPSTIRSIQVGEHDLFIEISEQPIRLEVLDRYEESTSTRQTVQCSRLESSRKGLDEVLSSVFDRSISSPAAAPRESNS